MWKKFGEKKILKNLKKMWKKNAEKTKEKNLKKNFLFERRGQFLTVRPQTKTLTMEQLLVTLIKRAQLECEESHRMRVSAANGLAALHIIRSEWIQAAECYRDVLRYFFSFSFSFFQKKN